MSVVARSERSSWLETAIIIAEALAIAMFVRVFLYQPFNIPSGSMKNTLLIGDYLFVSKLSYGYSKYSFPRTATVCIPFTGACSTFRILPDLIPEGRIFSAEPKRGDVAVFRKPADNETDYIKRVIGLPGDKIQMKDGMLYINGTAVPKKKVDTVRSRESSRFSMVSADVYEETLPNGVTYHVLDFERDGVFDNTNVYEVPEGHYFMMGDNRDNSSDSRDMSPGGVGYVPFENFIGRAEIIFFSAKVDEPDAFRWYAPWRWPFDIRWNRFFKLVR
ncbi:MAG: signal peptidase I [Hyphomicrobium sp.]|jgi:signal peptidase I|nr:signal peptidase I [Hyphomicrobium sp.]